MTKVFRHKHSLLAFASGVAVSALLAADPAFAQAADGASKPEAEIVVLGTRRQDRTVTNSASPIDVISSADLQSQPAGDMLDTVKNIVPSFFVGQNSISDASTFVRSPSLRGLPGDEVLVMLDGKRLNRSALVQVYSGGDTALSYGAHPSDISSIPSIAIKNLQILREGATAQYGSDAIAGVMNYGLRDNAKGLILEGRYGQYYDKGDGKSYQVSANLGLALTERGFLNLSAEVDDDGQTSRGATRPLAVYLAQSNPAVANSIPGYANGLPAQIWGNSPNHGYKIVVNSAYEVTDNSKIYMFANVAHSKADESFNYRSPVTTAQTFLDVAGNPHSLNGNGAFRGAFAATFLALYPGGFTPRFVGKKDEAIGVVGYKGKLDNGFTWDLSASTSRNGLNLSMYNSLNPAYGAATKTTFQFGTLVQKETNATLDVTYPIAVAGFASPVTVSAGAEYRHEAYTQPVSELQAYDQGGASGYGGTAPADAGTWSQNSYAGYLGLESDITQALSVGLAGRYEHYNTFGDATVGKINALYKISDNLSVRGTVGTGFHAPSPGQSHVSILTTNFIAGNQVQTGTFPVGSAISQAFGAKPLTPEKSTNYGFGFVGKPTSAITLSVDFYAVKVRNHIYITNPFPAVDALHPGGSVTAADIVAFPSLAAVGVGGQVNFFTNGLSTLTRGVDAVATYRTMFADGKLNLTLAYNYNKSTVSSFDPNVISNAQIIDIQRLAPNHRGTFSANWQKGSWTINTRANYYGAWRVEEDYPGQEFGAKVTADLDVTYAYNEHMALTLGASNLFNTYPDKIQNSAANPVYQLTGSTADGQIYPRSGGPFGMNGGFWYVRARITY